MKNQVEVVNTSFSAFLNDNILNTVGPWALKGLSFFIMLRMLFLVKYPCVLNGSG